MMKQKSQIELIHDYASAIQGWVFWSKKKLTLINAKLNPICDSSNKDLFKWVAN